MTGPTPASPAAPAGPPPQPVFNLRMAIGLLGIFLAAVVAGLNGRIPSLVLPDLRGALGIGIDEASWLLTAYSAGELAAMPFATWFAITFSMRRFHLAMLFSTLLLTWLMPYVQDLPLLLTLRVFQGLLGGAMIPLLMVACMRFLPLPIRLHGLAVFALVATFSPNIALWIASQWVDQLEDWRWVYWHVIPIGLLAAMLVGWGIPKMPLALPRMKQANWFGMLLGVPGLMLLVVGVDQGVRLDWFHSPLIVASFVAGGALFVLYLIGEWFHPAPFVSLRMLARRNIWIGLTLFGFLLMTMATAVTLPANLLANFQGFRLAQSAPLGLIVGFPQLLLGSCVALLLYQRWADARYVFVAGLLCMAAANWLASGITSEWMVQQFLWVQVLHMLGQPLTMVSLLFLITSVMQPMETPLVAGQVHIVRVFSATIGGAIIGQLTAVRSRFHSEMLLDNAGQLMARLPSDDPGWVALSSTVAQQANVLAAADIYRVFAVVALLMIPLALMMQRIPAPAMTSTPPVTPSATPATAASVAA
ncbi:MFS transporter [Pseudomonas aeruginosa]|mgnify:CR=1 FL=1|uniref:MFS transporter n=1 Tax=Pseudomonas aeruginosa TaxID=287 RepID=UPI00249E5150|nr:MFS transporter [Pseudomonas aeruginosa]MDI3610809.1 MFS transporter [Pseudomonas aeruginosa]MDI3677690.1 MFS transporter [Pseudomonas aeruginosa]MDI3708044.1 MFS transporter [Pseudomonas aeruginosa]MDI3762313.1 MFS transporter [Pseudomonas aeruginosa]MDI3781096.1 MFS transporter [Pseudomonas aeruginosa]